MENIFDTLFFLLISPLTLVMEGLLKSGYWLTEDYGFAIILMSIGVNILILPLYYLAEKFKAQDKELQAKMKPEIEKIKNHYKGRERHFYIQSIYRRYGHHPSSSIKASLSFLIQIPFFIAAFTFLANFEPLQSVSFGPITNLSGPDKILGGINLLPIAMTVVNLLSALIYVKEMERAEKLQLLGLAFAFLILLYNEPAGLLLYWTMNNVFSLFKNLFDKKFKKPKVNAKTDIRVELKKQDQPKSGHSYINKNFGFFIFTFAGILQIPQQYFLANIGEFSNDIFLISIPFLLSAFLLAIYSAANAVLKKLIRSFTGYGDNTQLFFAAIGAAILICDQLVRLDFAKLDGAAQKISIDPTFAAINTIIFIGLPILFIKFGKKIKSRLVDGSKMLIVLTLGLSIHIVSKSIARSKIDTPIIKRLELEHSQNAENQTRPNVYLIWLDAMQTDFMEKNLKSKSVSDAFNGFTLFRNNSSNYIYSQQSYQSFMSGTLYKGGLYSKWKERKERLRKVMGELGYDASTYSSENFLSPEDYISYNSRKIAADITGKKHPYISDFIAFWVVRSFPSAASNYTLQLGKKIGSELSSRLNTVSKYENITSVADGIEPLTAVLILQEAKSDEKSRKGHNQFVIIQADIPHGPQVIDKNCEYRGRKKGPERDAYFEQVQCATNLTVEFFDELKRLGRFDSSLIIVMGDHGSGWADQIIKTDSRKGPLNKEYTSWSPSMIISRSSALLMIKPPLSTVSINKKNSSKHKISLNETQLLDLFPTILTQINAEDKIPDDIEGFDVFKGPIVAREKYFTYFAPAVEIEPHTAEIYDLGYSKQGGLNSVTFRSKLKEKRVSN